MKSLNSKQELLKTSRSGVLPTDCTLVEVKRALPPEHQKSLKNIHINNFTILWFLDEASRAAVHRNGMLSLSKASYPLQMPAQSSFYKLVLSAGMLFDREAANTIALAGGKHKSVDLPPRPSHFFWVSFESETDMNIFWEKAKLLTFNDGMTLKIQRSQVIFKKTLYNLTAARNPRNKKSINLIFPKEGNLRSQNHFLTPRKARSKRF